MPDKFVLTIIDENGSKQLRLSRHVKRHVLLITMLVIGLLLAGGWFLGYLVEKISKMTLEKVILETNYKNLYTKNNTLKLEISQKTQEIALVSRKIKDFENLVQVKKSQGDDAYSSVDLKQLSIPNKTLALALIPNGEPIKTYSTKTLINSPNKRSLGPYHGYNFNTTPDTPVYATASGVVDVVLIRNYQGYGKLIRLEHAFGFSSIYARLNSIVIKRHAFVQKGELLGYSSNNLHYEIRFLGRIVDMPKYMDWDMAHFDSIFKDDSQVSWKNLFYSIKDMAHIREKRQTTEHLGVMGVAE
ncbi:M23 family metallopeptidase [Helicobacter suis]|uniref:M23 family metallopeptidase n=1 Tax=Helicobacter suis TaxID=104628 RepID=UPI0024912FDC|nr:M23 family metallopeptidase [Helicobacter suis]